MAHKKSSSPLGNKPKGRRTTATLDLKATEVTENKPENPDKAKSSASSVNQKSSASDSSVNKKSSTSTPPPKKPNNTDAKALKNSSKAGSGFTGHIFSGLAGGAMALLGILGFQHYGIGTMSTNGASEGSSSLPSQIVSRIDTLEQRINALPKTATEKIQPVPTGEFNKQLEKLTSIEAGLQKLEIENAELRARTNAAEKGLAAVAGKDIPDEIKERLHRFEKTISALASSAENPAQSNIGEIAALVGRINEFEAMLDTKVEAIRKTITNDLVATAPDTASPEIIENLTAKNQQLAGEIETLREEALNDRKQFAADAENITKIADEIKNLQQKISASNNTSQSLLSQLEALKSNTRNLEKNLVKNDNVKTEMAALSENLKALTDKIEIVNRHQNQQRQNASNVLLSLELADLKRAIEQGKPYTDQLNQVKQLAGNTTGLAALDQYKNQEVLSTKALTKSFRKIANRLLTNTTDGKTGSIFSKILANAKGIVRIRKTGEPTGDTTEAILARMETRLKNGDLAAVLREGKSLPERAQIKVQDWLEQIEARYTIDRSLQALQSRFKSSLAPITGGTPQ